MAFDRHLPGHKRSLFTRLYRSEKQLFFWFYKDFFCFSFANSPFLAVPISWSSIALIWSEADILSKSKTEPRRFPDSEGARAIYSRGSTTIEKRFQNLFSILSVLDNKKEKLEAFLQLNRVVKYSYFDKT